MTSCLAWNILDFLGYLGWSSLPLPFLSHLHLIKTCVHLGLDLGHYGIKVLLHLVFPVHQFICLITGTGGMVHPPKWISLFLLFQKHGTQFSQQTLTGKQLLDGRVLEHIFSIFWLNSSSGTGKTSLGSPCSSWSRVSPELMELVSSSRLDFVSWPAFLLCSILELPVAGSCRTTSVGRALEGLNCQSLPPLLSAYWVHGQVDCLNHCNILMAFSNSRVLFTDSNSRAFFRIHTPGD